MEKTELKGVNAVSDVEACFDDLGWSSLIVPAVPVGAILSVVSGGRFEVCTT